MTNVEKSVKNKSIFNLSANLIFFLAIIIALIWVNLGVWKAFIDYQKVANKLDDLEDAIKEQSLERKIQKHKVTLSQASTQFAREKSLLADLARIKEKLAINLASIILLFLFYGSYMFFKYIAERRRLGQVIRQIKLSEKKYKELSKIDSLTGLPNRNAFDETLRALIARYKRSHYKFALIMIDIDNFKTVNDTYGHQLGDTLLKEVANRFSACIREIDHVARLSGDEFAILQEDVVHPATVALFCERVIEAFKKPIRLDKNEVQCTVSMGISFFPESGETFELIIRNSDVALYQAKSNGKNCFQFFTKEINDNINRYVEIEKNLIKSIEEKDFFILYQPQFDIKTGKIVVFEALLRWNCESLGEVGPEEFLPIAEQIGKINEITLWLIQKISEDYKTLNKKLLDKFLFSINLTGKQIINENSNFVIAEKIKKLEFDFKDIVIEIMEIFNFKNRAMFPSILNAYSNMGVKIALDDFGTRYSSITLLNEIKANFVKIDRSVISGITTRPDACLFIKSVILIARLMGTKVIAEGVETKEQLDFLKENDCDIAQGFYLSKPLRFEDAKKLMEKEVV